MAVSLGELFVKIGARDDGFTKKISRIEVQLHRLSSNFRHIGVTAGIGFGAATAAMGAATRAAAQLERGVAEAAAISSKGGKEYAKTFAEMKGRTLELAGATEFTAKEVVGGFKFMSMAGVQLTDQLGAIGDVLRLASAAGEDVAKSADILTNAMMGMGRSIREDGTDTTNIMVSTFTSANTSLAQLGGAFKQAGPKAAQFGTSMEEVAAAIGIFSNAGLQGEQAGTGIRNLLARISKPGGQAKKALDALGLSMRRVQDAPGGQGLSQLAADLGKAKRSLNKADFTQLLEQAFGNRTSNFAAIFAEFGEEGMKELKASIEKGKIINIAKVLEDRFKNTTVGQTKLLGSALANLAVIVGDVLLPAFTMFVSTVRGLVDFLNGLSPVTQKLVVGFALVTTAVLGLVTASALLISAFARTGAGIASLIGSGAQLNHGAATGEEALVALGTTGREAIGGLADSFKKKVGGVITSSLSTAKAAMSSFNKSMVKAPSFLGSFKTSASSAFGKSRKAAASMLNVLKTLRAVGIADLGLRLKEMAAAGVAGFKKMALGAKGLLVTVGKIALVFAAVAGAFVGGLLLGERLLKVFGIHVDIFEEMEKAWNSIWDVGVLNTVIGLVYQLGGVLGEIFNNIITQMNSIPGVDIQFRLPGVDEMASKFGDFMNSTSTDVINNIAADIQAKTKSISDKVKNLLGLGDSGTAALTGKDPKAKSIDKELGRLNAALGKLTRSAQESAVAQAAMAQEAILARKDITPSQKKQLVQAQADLSSAEFGASFGDAEDLSAAMAALGEAVGKHDEIELNIEAFADGLASSGKKVLERIEAFDFTGGGGVSGAEGFAKAMDLMRDAIAKSDMPGFADAAKEAHQQLAALKQNSEDVVRAFASTPDIMARELGKLAESSPADFNSLIDSTGFQAVMADFASEMAGSPETLEKFQRLLSQASERVADKSFETAMVLDLLAVSAAQGTQISAVEGAAGGTFEGFKDALEKLKVTFKGLDANSVALSKGYKKLADRFLDGEDIFAGMNLDQLKIAKAELIAETGIDAEVINAKAQKVSLESAAQETANKNNALAGKQAGLFDNLKGLFQSGTSGDASSSISGFAQNLGGLQTKLASFAKSTAGATGTMGKMGGLAAKAAPALGSLGAAAGPIGIGLAAATVYLKSLVETFKFAGQQIQNAIKGIADAVGQVAGDIVSDVGDGRVGQALQFLTTAVGALAAGVLGAGALLVGMAGIIAGPVTGALLPFSAALLVVGTGLTLLVGPLITLLAPVALLAVASAATAAALLLVAGVAGVVTGALLILGKNTKSFEVFKQGIQQAVEPFFNALEPIYERLQDLIPIVELVSWAAAELVDVLISNDAAFGLLFDTVKFLAKGFIRLIQFTAHAAVAFGHFAHTVLDMAAAIVVITSSWEHFFAFGLVAFGRFFEALWFSLKDIAIVGFSGIFAGIADLVFALTSPITLLGDAFIGLVDFIEVLAKAIAIATGDNPDDVDYSAANDWAKDLRDSNPLQEFRDYWAEQQQNSLGNIGDNFAGGLMDVFDQFSDMAGDNPLASFLKDVGDSFMLESPDDAFFDDIINNLDNLDRGFRVAADGIDELNEALTNVPDTFRVTQARFDAAAATSSFLPNYAGPGDAIGTGAFPGLNGNDAVDPRNNGGQDGDIGGSSVRIDNVRIAAESFSDFVQQIQQEARAYERRSGTNTNDGAQG